MDYQNALTNYYAAFADPNNNSDLILAGVPSPKDAATGRYGDVLSPVFGGHNPVAEVYDNFLAPVGRGDLAGPANRLMEVTGGIANVPLDEGLNALLQLYRAPRAGAATAFGEGLLAKEQPQNAIARLRGEIDNILAEGRDLGVRRDPDLHRMIDVAKAPEQEINQLQFIRNDLANKLTQNRAELDARNANLPQTSVPSVDPRPVRDEYFQIGTHVASNPYVQPIKGRQGFPTKQEQLDLVRDYFQGGGRLSPDGPWGGRVNIEEDIRSILADAMRRGKSSRQEE